MTETELKKIIQDHKDIAAEARLMGDAKESSHWFFS